MWERLNSENPQSVWENISAAAVFAFEAAGGTSEADVAGSWGACVYQTGFFAQKIDVAATGGGGGKRRAAMYRVNKTKTLIIVVGYLVALAVVVYLFWHFIWKVQLINDNPSKRLHFV